MSCLKKLVDDYIYKFAVLDGSITPSDINITRLRIAKDGIRDKLHRQGLGSRSPSVSDTPLDLPRGSLRTKASDYTIVEDSYCMFGQTPCISPRACPDCMDIAPQTTTPSPVCVWAAPDALISAAVAFGANQDTVNILITSQDLQFMIDPVFESVASINCTLREISDDITLFTRRLGSIKMGLNVLEKIPRDGIEFNLSRLPLYPDDNSRPDDKMVRKWLRELLVNTPSFELAWRLEILFERQIFNESSRKLMSALEGRLDRCQKDVEHLEWGLWKVRNSLSECGDPHGQRFGNPWLRWADEGIFSLKDSVRQLSRFISDRK